MVWWAYGAVVVVPAVEVDDEAAAHPVAAEQVAEAESPDPAPGTAETSHPDHSVFYVGALYFGCPYLF